MIRECPVNIECRVFERIDRRIHAVFAGEVAGVHVDSSVLRSGDVEVTAIHPAFYAPDLSGDSRAYAYWGLGKKIARAFEVGKELAVVDPEA